MKEEQDKYTPNDDSEQEIDLLELAKKIWASRAFVLKFCLYGLIVGLVVAFSIPKEYTTTIKLAPEVASGKAPGGNLGALASFAGLSSMGSTSEAVYPQLYPDIVASIPFSVSLFDIPVTDVKGEHTMTVRKFIEEETSSPWWSSVFGLPFKAIGAVKSLVSDKTEENDGELNTFRLTER